jgi:outer membrane lipoprotein
MSNDARYRFCLTSLWIMVSLAACTSIRFEGTEDRLQVLPRDLMSDGVPVPRGTVIWGGRILEIVNFEEVTEILVLAYPLTTGNVPRVDEESVGRFVIRFEGYLEPLDFTPGRYLSMAGQLQGKSDEWAYEGTSVELPLVRSKQVHLWPRDQASWRTRINFGLSVFIHN